jgi:hypothetical protein
MTLHVFKMTLHIVYDTNNKFINAVFGWNFD